MSLVSGGGERVRDGTFILFTLGANPDPPDVAVVDGWLQHEREENSGQRTEQHLTGGVGGARMRCEERGWGEGWLNDLLY